MEIHQSYKAYNRTKDIIKLISLSIFILMILVSSCRKIDNSPKIIRLDSLTKVYNRVELVQTSDTQYTIHDYILREVLLIDNYDRDTSKANALLEEHIKKQSLLASYNESLFLEKK